MTQAEARLALEAYIMKTPYGVSAYTSLISYEGLFSDTQAINFIKTYITNFPDSRYAQEKYAAITGKATPGTPSQGTITTSASDVVSTNPEFSESLAVHCDPTPCPPLQACVQVCQTDTSLYTKKEINWMGEGVFQGMELQQRPLSKDEVTKYLSIFDNFGFFNNAFVYPYEQAAIALVMYQNFKKFSPDLTINPKITKIVTDIPSMDSVLYPLFEEKKKQYLQTLSMTAEEALDKYTQDEVLFWGEKYFPATIAKGKAAQLSNLQSVGPAIASDITKAATGVKFFLSDKLIAQLQPVLASYQKRGLNFSLSSLFAHPMLSYGLLKGSKK